MAEGVPADVVDRIDDPELFHALMKSPSWEDVTYPDQDMLLFKHDDIPPVAYHTDTATFLSDTEYQESVVYAYETVRHQTLFQQALEEVEEHVLTGEPMSHLLYRQRHSTSRPAAVGAVADGHGIVYGHVENAGDAESYLALTVSYDEEQPGNLWYSPVESTSLPRQDLPQANSANLTKLGFVRERLLAHVDAAEREDVRSAFNDGFRIENR